MFIRLNVVESPRRHFLPWDRPLLPQAVAWLAAGWDGIGPLDLSRTLVVVSTAQAGRRLREALAAAAALRGQGVFAPRVVTPDSLLALDPAPDAAPRLVSVLAWAEVFRAIDLEAFRAVFPIDPPARNFSWALRLGREFARLQAALAEGGLGLPDVAQRAGPEFPEAARWEAIGRLATLHAGRLATAGLREPQAARMAEARQPPAGGVDRIVMLATPDPLPLALEALAAQARRVPVEVVIFAPASEAGNFDAWGRPLAAAAEGSGHDWGRREIALPDFEHRVRLCANPAAQAEQLAAIAVAAEPRTGQLALGAADPEVLGPLESALARAGVVAFNPEGRSRRNDGLHGLLAALAALAAAPDFDAGAALVRCPDVLAWLQRRAGPAFSPARLLAELDALHAKHLPPTLAAAQAQAADFPLAAQTLAAVAELREQLISGEFPGNAAATLATLFGDRRVDVGGSLADSAEYWIDVLRDAGRALALFPGARPTTAEAWEFALEEFASGSHTVERPPEALDLLGWLELLWEDAPHLVVAGFNDGRVPEAVTGDPFLPESLRVRLGMKTNAARFARDAYLLSALSASRGDAGRLDLLFGKNSAAGDPLRPSRLLLCCADADLPARVTGLFRPLAPERPGLPWSRAWRLGPRRVAPPPRVSVTGLRDWLHCPFRYYLKHVLRMSAVDPAKAELDAGDFGTLLHGAWQQLGEDAALRDCADPVVIEDFLIRRFERGARDRYGADLTLPLVVQFESARQRLRAAAVIEAAERAAGWRTVQVEWAFRVPLGPLELRGKIDRIDRHPDGRVRVIDYKTGDTARLPALTHLRPARSADAAVPAWQRCHDAAGKDRIWIDLQLPLYRRAVLAEWGAAVECGYFNLPKATGETGLSPWSDYTTELQTAAERCAEAVAAEITAGTFWPPVEMEGREADWDEFAPLFHKGAAASVEFGK